MEIKDEILWRHYEDHEGTTSHLPRFHAAFGKKFCKTFTLEAWEDISVKKRHWDVSKRFYWPGYFKYVQNWCNTCSVCATRKTPPAKGKAPLKSVQASYLMQIVATDIMGPLPESAAGNSYVLVASDYFNRWVEVYAIPNQEALTVARKLVDEMFCRFSPPDQLHSDQGR